MFSQPCISSSAVSNWTGVSWIILFPYKFLISLSWPGQESTAWSPVNVQQIVFHSNLGFVQMLTVVYSRPGQVGDTKFRHPTAESLVFLVNPQSTKVCKVCCTRCTVMYFVISLLLHCRFLALVCILREENFERKGEGFMAARTRLEYYNNGNSNPIIIYRCFQRVALYVAFCSRRSQNYMWIDWKWNVDAFGPLHA